MSAVKVSEASREQVKAALDQGALREVVIFCDVCGLEMATDMIGDTAEERFDGARAYLRNRRGWISSEGKDVCTLCAAGIKRVCLYPNHDFCEHAGSWDIVARGIAIDPEDRSKFEQAYRILTGEAEA